MDKGFDDKTKRMLEAVLASSQGQNIMKALSRDPERLEQVRKALLGNDTSRAKQGLEQMLGADESALSELDSLRKKFEL